MLTHTFQRTIGMTTHRICGCLRQTIDDVERVLGELADGNLTVDVTKNEDYYIGDFRMLAESLKSIHSNLTHVIQNVSRAASQVDSTAVEKSAAVSKELSNQARTLNCLIGRFHISRRTAAHVRTHTERNCEQAEVLCMSKRYKRYLSALILAAALLSGCAGGSAGSEPADGSASQSESSAVQVSFEAADVEGNTVSSSVFSQSKLTMVNVWATYCNPCLSEMPSLGELAEEYDAEELQIIGVISDVLEGEDASAAESLIRQTGANYTHLLLNESLYYGLLSEVSAVPTTFFLDENGTVLDVVVGAKTKTAWEEIIDGLLDNL